MLWRFLLPFSFFCFSLFTFLDSFFLFIYYYGQWMLFIPLLGYCVVYLCWEPTQLPYTYSYEESLWDRKIYVQSFCLYFPFSPYDIFATVNNKNVEEVLEKHSDNVCGITICRMFFCSRKRWKFEVPLSFIIVILWIFALCLTYVEFLSSACEYHVRFKYFMTFSAFWDLFW